MNKSILAVCLLSIFFLPCLASAQNYPVAWETKSINQTIGLGGATNALVSFNSKVNLNNVDIFIASKIRPFLTASQNHFDTISQKGL